MPSGLAHEISAVTHVDVWLAGARVGTLACPAPGAPALFEYDASWLTIGFSISPFSLPLRQGLFEADSSMQDGLFGVFRDSLPDDWGRLVQDRRMAELGVRAGSLTPLARLALVGSGGLGALEYTPSLAVEPGDLPASFDDVSAECQRLIDEHGTEGIDALYTYGSSSGGARPKVMVELDGAPWIVKFPARLDGSDAGLAEFRYAEAARACGIEMAECRLLPSAMCAGYFATQRFDRVRDASGAFAKVHMVSAAALLEASPFDALDYRDLMRLSLALSASARDTEQLFRVMCFNVFAGNCDDHARNFSFLYDVDLCAWRFSPAYDLTRSEGFFGEHATLVNGKGADVDDGDLLAIGKSGGISARGGREIIEEIRSTVAERLGL